MKHYLEVLAAFIKFHCTVYKTYKRFVFVSGFLSNGWQFNVLFDKQVPRNSRGRYYFSLAIYRWYIELHFYDRELK